ncbi:hypothetical protein [Vibrio diazotrophicus]|uniref:hypothetical protein n=1 Tax=Vibrio diazotrophicus TaxID=685 RepID=UPI0020CBA494|nr:hypothetical protein [Vibrio diazotrophicus]
MMGEQTKIDRYCEEANIAEAKDISCFGNQPETIRLLAGKMGASNNPANKRNTISAGKMKKEFGINVTKNVPKLTTDQNIKKQRYRYFVLILSNSRPQGI